MQALGTNLFIISISVLILWFPAVLLGMWGWRARRAMLPAQLFLLFLLIVSTIVVPLPASRGTLSHALVALQPWMAIWAVVGVQSLCALLNRPQYCRAIEIAGMSATICVTATLVRYASVVKYAPTPPYREVEAAVVQQGAKPGEPLLFDDPLTYEWMTGRPALVLPSEGTGAIAPIAAAYGIRFVLVSPNNQQTFVFDESRPDQPHFAYRTTVGGVAMYEKVP